MARNSVILGGPSVSGKIPPQIDRREGEREPVENNDLKPRFFLQFLVNPEAGKNDNSTVIIMQVGFTVITFDPRPRRRELRYFRTPQHQVVLYNIHICRFNRPLLLLESLRRCRGFLQGLILREPASVQVHPLYRMVP